MPNSNSSLTPQACSRAISGEGERRLPKRITLAPPHNVLDFLAFEVTHYERLRTPHPSLKPQQTALARTTLDLIVQDTGTIERVKR